MGSPTKCPRISVSVADSSKAVLRGAAVWVDSAVVKHTVLGSLEGRDATIFAT